MKMSHIFSPLIFTLSFCALLFFSAAKKDCDGRWSYKVEASKTLSFEERKKVLEIYTIRLTGLGIKKGDFAMAWDGNTVNVIISNPGKYGGIREEITKMLSAEGRLAFWETYSRSEIASSLVPALRAGGSLSSFLAMFDSTSIKSSSSDDQGCLFGYLFENKKNNFTGIMDSLQLNKTLPANLKFAFLSKPNVEYPGAIGVISLKTKTDGTARFDNPKLTEVKMITNKSYPGFEISMRMDSVAAVKWAIMTRENTGRSIAFVIDGAVLMYPNVSGSITGGVSSITGNFDKAEAEQIVTLLKTGPLPSPMKMVEINNGNQ
jgi:hypothetical protein